MRYITFMIPFVTAAVVIFVYMSCIFLLALALKDNSIVDIAYGGVFITVAASTAMQWWSSHPRQVLLLILVTIWGFRLTVHLLFRKRGKGEDFRYRKWREQWGRFFVIRSFFQIYMLQGSVILIVASPVIAAVAWPGRSLGVLDLLGAAVWLTGIFF
jgi:steroid 5-alpha reductase family enzyme